MQPSADEDNDDVIESFWLYICSVFSSFVYYYLVQKKCLRILFGNLEQFLDNFNTCARARPFGAQILSSQFYMREHTKPIFSRPTSFLQKSS